VAPGLIAAQFDALTEAPIAAYRIGALLDAASVEVVAARLGAGVPVVYDPVLAPSAGGVFTDAATRAVILARLLPLVSVVTPNLAEAEVLSGVASVGDAAGMERAGRALVAAGARSALIKGGHLEREALDVLVDARGATTYAAPRLSGDLRGTGCLLACSLAAALARGASIPAAVERARAFVRECFTTSVAAGGMQIY
jgi:hydroxymethylpyrimidine/phosphomethylpyrimidine kinase